jgi:pimeloyl-ACP methyl ester carboxylesterase
MPTMPNFILVMRLPMTDYFENAQSAACLHSCHWWQVGRFIRDADVRREFVPLLYQQFDATPSARPAFFRLNEDLREFRRPVRIIFGDADPSLNSGVARMFHEFLPGSELFLIPGARHFVQLHEPEQVVRLILSTPTTESSTTGRV